MAEVVQTEEQWWAEDAQRLNELAQSARSNGVAIDLPEPEPTDNAFCATGEGGGVDPTCSPSESDDSIVSKGQPGYREAVLYAWSEGGTAFEDPEVVEEIDRIVREEGKVHKTIHRGMVVPANSSIAKADVGAEIKFNKVSSFSKSKAFAVDTAQVLEGAGRGEIPVVITATGAKGYALKDEEGAYPEQKEVISKGSFKVTERVEKKGIVYLKVTASEPTENVFCPTGPGGGRDPSCSPGSSGSGLKASIETEMRGMNDSEKKEFRSLRTKFSKLNKKVKDGTATDDERSEREVTRMKITELKEKVKQRGGDAPRDPDPPKPPPIDPPKPPPTPPVAPPKPPTTPTSPGSQGTSTTSPSVKHAKVEKKYHKMIDKAEGLTPEHKQAYKVAMTRVINNLSERALTKFKRGCGTAEFCRSMEEVTKRWNAEPSRAHDGRHSVRVNGYYYDPQTNHATGERKPGRMVLDGWVDNHTFPIHVGDPMNLKPKIYGTYAHEIGHAIDYKSHLSNQKSWNSAWKKEIGEPGSTVIKLTKYGQTSACEGFAEFSRLVYSGDVPRERVKTLFPKCYKFFERKGLV